MMGIKLVSGDEIKPTNLTLLFTYGIIIYNMCYEWYIRIIIRHTYEASDSGD